MSSQRRFSPAVASSSVGMEQAVNRLADERDTVQKKTFTKWVNKHLGKAGLEVRDLFQDLRDGRKLLKLLEMFTGEKLTPEKGRMRFHFMQNVANALKCLTRHKVKVVNIHPEHIVDGNPKITLGLIWTLILHFQISEIADSAAPESSLSAKESVLKWCQTVTEGYPNVRVLNFTTTWRDGMAFNAVIHRHRPELIDMPSLSPDNAIENLENAFSVAETELGVTRLLDPEDVNVANPDDRSILTYVASLWEVFPVLPERPAEAPDAKWDEYKTIAFELLEWMELKIEILDDRDFPDNIPDMEILIENFEKFKVEEIPEREKELNTLEQMWNELKILHTQSSVPFSCPEEIELDELCNLWKVMFRSKRECEIALLAWLERLKRLLAIAEKVKETVEVCEVELNILEERINKGESEWPTMDPVEVERDVTAIDVALQEQEQPIQGMKEDVAVLVKESWHEGSFLSSKVEEVYIRWETLYTRLTLFNNKKTSMVTLTLQTLKSVDEALQWVRQKKAYLEININNYGSDLDEVQVLSKDFWSEVQTIMDFRKRVTECHNLRFKFAASCKGLTDLEAKLADLDIEYDELTRMTEYRRENLHYLVMFLSRCRSVSDWIKGQQSLLSGISWGDMNVMKTKVEENHNKFQKDAESFKEKFENCVKEHNELLAAGHPAVDLIKSCIDNLRKWWPRVATLLECYESHLTVYWQAREFYDVLQELQLWVYEKLDLTENVYRYVGLSREEIDERQKNMTSLNDEFETQYRRVSVLKVQCGQVRPLELRRMSGLKRERVPIKAICTFEEFDVEKDDVGELIEVKSYSEWDVELERKGPMTCPGFVFHVPPPSTKAKQDLARLQGLFGRLRERLNWHFLAIEYVLEIIEILKEITIIKSWELDELFDDERASRQAIVTGMNTRFTNLKPKISNISQSNQDLDSYQLPNRVTEANEYWDLMCRRYANFEAGRDVNQLSRKTRGAMGEVMNYLVLVDTMMVEQKRVAWNMAAARRQETVVKAVALDVAAHTAQYNEVERWATAIVARNSSEEEAAGIGKEMETVKRRWESVYEETRRRQTRIRKSIKQLEKYRNDKIPPFIEWLEGAEARMKNFKKPGKSMQQLVKQIEEHKAFSEQVKQNSSQLDSVVCDGKGIIQISSDFDGQIQLYAARDAQLEPLPLPDSISAYQVHIHSEAERIAQEDGLAPIDSADLEPYSVIVAHEINADLVCRYKKLQERIERRTQELDEAMRYRENFNMAVDSLEPWLEGTEAEVEAEIPTVVEPEVVMQKIEQVEMMENNVLKRQPDVDSLQVAADTFLLTLGGQIRPIDNSSEEESDEDDIPDGNTVSAHSKPSDVSQRMSDILAKLRARKEMLLASLPKSLAFNASCDEFDEWLRQAETKSVVAVNLPSLENETLKAQLQEQQAFQLDVSEHQAALDSLNDSGANVIAESPSDKANVEERLQSLNSRFATVDTNSKSRLSDLEKGLPLLERFKKLYDEITACVHNIQQQQFDEQRVGLTDAILSQQANENASQKEEIDTTNTNISALASLADEIVDLWTPLLMHQTTAIIDDAFESSVDLPLFSELEPIHEKVESVTKACNDVSHHATVRCAAIQDSLTKVRNFDSLATDFEAWLSKKEAEVETFEPLSANLEWLNPQMSASTEFVRDIDDHKPLYSSVQSNGLDLIGYREASDEGVRMIQLRLDEITRRWNNLNVKAAQRTEAVTVVVNYMEKYKPFVKWLGENEQVVLQFEPMCLSVEALREQTREIEAVQTDVAAYSEMYNDVIAAGQSVVALGGYVDEDGYKKEIHDVEEMWEDMGLLIETRAEKLQEVSAILGPLQGEYQQLIDWISAAKDTLRNTTSQEAAVEDDKTKQERLKAFADSIADHKDSYRDVLERGQQLINDVSDANVSPLEQQLDDLQQQWNSLQGAECNEQLDQLLQWIKLKENEMADWQPVALREEPISQQFVNLEMFESDLTLHNDEVKTMNEKSEVLLSELSRDDSEHSRLKQHLNDLNNQLDQLHVGAAERRSCLDEGMDKARKFEVATLKLVPWLENAEIRVRQIVEAEVEPEEMKEQQVKIQEFNDEVSKQKPELEDVVEAGNSLIQGCNSEREDVKVIIVDVEDWTERYNQLNQAIQNYWDKVMEQMSSASQFGGLYDAVLKWLVQARDQVRTFPSPALTVEGIDKQMEFVEDLESAVKGKEYEINSFVTKGNELALETKSSGESKIKAKVDDVQSKWSDLQAAAADLNTAYITTRGKAEKYEDGYKEFDQYLTIQEELVGSFSGIGVRPEDVSTQIAETNAVQAGLQEHELELQGIDNLAADLCDGRQTDDPNKLFIDSNVASLHERYDSLKKRVADYAAKAADALPKVEKYNVSFCDLNDWLNSFTDQVRNVKPVGIKPATVQQQVDELKSFCSDLNSHKPQLDDVVAAGNDMLAIGRPRGDQGTENVMSELSEMQSQWNSNVKALKDRQALVSACLPLSQQYHPLVCDMEQFLDKTDETLHKFDDLPVDPATLQALQREVDSIEKDIKDHEETLVKAKKVGEEFTSCRPEDDSNREEILSQLASLEEKYSTVKEDAGKLASRLCDALEKAKQATSQLDDVLQWIKEKHEEVESADTPGVEQEEVEKQMDSHLVFSGSVDEYEPKVSEACDATRQLLDKDKGGSDLEATLMAVSDSWNSLGESIAKRKEKLEDGLTKAKHFKDMHDEMTTWLDETEEEIGKLAQTSIHSDVLQKQLEACKCLHGKVVSQQPVLDSFHVSASDLTECRSADDLGRQSVESKVQVVDERYSKLGAKIDELATALESSCGQTEKCEALWAELQPWLDEQKQRQLNVDPVASESEKLNSQLEECQAVIAAFDECQPRMDEFTSLSHDLLSGQSPEEEASIAFADRLQNASNLWNSLKDGADERKTAVGDALEKAGQFEAALQSLLTWLDSKEAEMEGWEPVALDIAPLEEQLGDNKTFRSDVSEHRPLLNAAASSASALTTDKPDTASCQLVSEKVADAHKRFDVVEKAGNDRKEELEATLTKSKAFHDNCDDLLGWLVVKADQLEHLPDVELKPQQIQDRIEELEAYSQQLEEQHPKKDDINAQLKSLIGSWSVDDPIVASPSATAAHVSSKFDELVKLLDDKLMQLKDALPVAEKVKAECDAITDWMNNARERLDVMQQAVATATDSQEKLDKLKELVCEAAEHESQVNEMKDDVAQLTALFNEDSEQTTALQRESDKLALEFKALKDVIDDKLKEHEAALSKVQGVQSLVVDVLDKLRPFEARLDTIEPYYVNVEKIEGNIAEVQQVEEEVNALQTSYESAVAAANEIQPSDSEPNESTAALINQWEDLKNKVEDMSDDLEAGLSRAEDFHDRLNEVTCWLEKKLADLGEAAPVKATPNAVKEQIHEYTPVFREIEVYRGDIQQFDKDVREFVTRIPDEHPDRKFIYENLNSIHEQYGQLEKSSTQRNTALTRGLNRAEKFQSDGSRLLLWLSSMQIDIESLQCSVADPDSVKDVIQKARDIQSDIDDHNSKLSLLADQAGQLTSHLEEEEPSKVTVIAKKQTVEERYRGLNPVIHCKLRTWEEVLPIAEELKEKADEVKKWIPLAEKALEECSGIPNEADAIREQQERVEAVLIDVEEHEAPVADLNSLLEGITRKLPDDEHQVNEATTDVTAVTKQYNSLQSVATTKRDALADALSKADAFQETFDDLKQKLDEVDATLVDLSLPLPLKTTDAEAQIEKAKNVEKQLTEIKPQLNELASRADELKAISDPESAASVDEKVDSMNDHYGRLQALLADLVPQLAASLERVTDFNRNADDLIKWLVEKSYALKDPFVPRAVPDGVKQQLDDHKNEFEDTLESKNSDLNDVLTAGKELKEKLSPEDAAVLQKTLTDVQTKWDDLSHQVVDRRAELEDALKQAETFESLWTVTMAAIADKTQQIDEMLPVGSDVQTVQDQMDELQDYQQSGEPVQNDVASLKADGRHLIESCDEQDLPIIKTKLEQLDTLWDSLQFKTTSRLRDLEDMAIKLGQFKDALADLLSWLTETEATLAAAKAKPIGSDVKTIMVDIEKTEAVNTDIESRKPSVKAVNDAGANSNDNGDTIDSELMKELDGVNSRYDAVSKDAVQLLMALKDALDRTERFEKDVQKLAAWISDVEEKLNEEKRVGGVPDTCRQQLADLEVLSSDISDHDPHFLALNSLALDVKNQGNSEDVEAKQLKLNNRWVNLKSKADEEHVKLEHALQTAEEFQHQHETVYSAFAELEHQLAECQPIAMEVHHIKQQLEEHKEFQKQMEPHRADVNALNESALAIVKVCQPDDKTEVEDQLSDINSRWNDLNQRSVARQQKLEEALLSAGQFQEALDELLAWVRDREASLHDAEPTTGDVEKLKLLLDRLKALERTVEARQPNYEAILKAGGVLVAQSDPHDGATLNESMADLKRHWMILEDALAAREKILEDALRHAIQFQASCGPLRNWIDGALPIVAEDQLVYGDTKIVDDLKAKHQSFLREIDGKQIGVDATTAEGEKLANEILDDGTDIEADVEQLTSKWNQLKDAAKAYGDDLDEAASMANMFGAPYEELMSKLAAFEQEVDNADIVAAEDMKLLETQQAQHTDFQRRVGLNQQSVDGMLANGSTILRRCHPRSAREIQQKVKDLNDLWKDVCDRSVGRQQEIDGALIKLRGLQQSIDEVAAWLTEAEAQTDAIEEKQIPDDEAQLQVLLAEMEARYTASSAELETVAEKFDLDGDGFVDYQELSAHVRLKRTPSVRYREPRTAAEKLDQEIHKVITKVSSDNQFTFTRVADATGRTNIDLRAMLRQPRENVTGLHTMGARTKTQSAVASKNRQTLAAAAQDKDAEVKTRQLPSGRRETVITKRKELREGEVVEVVDGVEYSGKLRHSTKTRRHVGTTVTRTTSETVVRQPSVIKRTVTRELPGGGTVEETRTFHEKASPVVTKKLSTTTTSHQQASSPVETTRTTTTTYSASPTADNLVTDDSDGAVVKTVEKKGAVTRITKVTKVSGSLPVTHGKRPAQLSIRTPKTALTSTSEASRRVREGTPTRGTPTKGSPAKSHIPVRSSSGKQKT